MRKEVIMAYKYGHRATAMNGVLIYLQKNYKKSDVVQGFYKTNSFISINELMKKYRQSRGSIPSKDYRKNANYIQGDFQSFMNYCRKELER